MRVPAGQPILSEWESRERLCLLVEGQAVLYTRYAPWRTLWRRLHLCIGGAGQRRAGWA